MQSTATDASEDWKVVCWCRTQASSHNLQGIADGKFDEAGMSIAAPDRVRSTLQLKAPGLGWLFAPLLFQHPNRSQQAASGVRRVMSASCEMTQGVGDTWATCPMLIRDTWGRNRSAGDLPFSQRLASLLLRWKVGRHRFCGAEF